MKGNDLFITLYFLPISTCTCYRINFALQLNEKVLICGPTGSGKGHLAKLALKDSIFISYGSLLESSTVPLYESPRQRLFRLLETALIQGNSVILGNLEELIEEPGLWLSLTAVSSWFHRLKDANLSIICTISSESKTAMALVKDHFLHVICVPKSSDFQFQLRFSDLKAAEKENPSNVQKVLDRMIGEGRTCSQLSNDNGSNTIVNTQMNLPSSSLTLDKVYGVKEDVKRLLLEQASFLKGTNGSRGVLLYGPPGTGKTQLALALSGSLGMGTKFISVSAADLLRAEIGCSELKLRETFNLARASQPAVIFFDEIDALFPKNPPFHLLSLQHQLIAEFDAMEREQQFTGTHCKVFLLAATNHLQKIDERILSIDRFELKLEIGLPDFNGRLDILSHSLLRKDDETINWTSFDDDFLILLASKTENKSPADLNKIIQDARKNSWKSKQSNLLNSSDFK